METNLEELKDWQDGARRMLSREIDRLKEELEHKVNLMRLMEVTDELLSEIDHLNSELSEVRSNGPAAVSIIIEEPKVVNVAGNYNDIHDNSCVGINVKQ